MTRVRLVEDVDPKWLPAGVEGIIYRKGGEYWKFMPDSTPDGYPLNPTGVRVDEKSFVVIERRP